MSLQRLKPSYRMCESWHNWHVTNNKYHCKRLEKTPFKSIPFLHMAVNNGRLRDVNEGHADDVIRTSVQWFKIRATMRKKTFEMSDEENT